MRICFVFCGLLLGALDARAEITVKEYKTLMKTENGRDAMGTYIKGLGEGIGWANVEGKFYCEPEHLGLGLENFIDISNRKIEDMSSTSSAEGLGKLPIGAVLFHGLKDTLPRPKGN